MVHTFESVCRNVLIARERDPSRCVVELLPVDLDDQLSRRVVLYFLGRGCVVCNHCLEGISFRRKKR